MRIPFLILALLGAAGCLSSTQRRDAEIADRLAAIEVRVQENNRKTLGAVGESNLRIARVEEALSGLETPTESDQSLHRRLGAIEARLTAISELIEKPASLGDGQSPTVDELRRLVAALASKTERLRSAGRVRQAARYERRLARMVTAGMETSRGARLSAVERLQALDADVERSLARAIARTPMSERESGDGVSAAEFDRLWREVGRGLELAPPTPATRSLVVRYLQIPAARAKGDPRLRAAIYVELGQLKSEIESAVRVAASDRKPPSAEILAIDSTATPAAAPRKEPVGKIATTLDGGTRQPPVRAERVETPADVTPGQLNTLWQTTGKALERLRLRNGRESAKPYLDRFMRIPVQSAMRTQDLRRQVYKQLGVLHQDILRAMR